ncbi:autotransporter outer membrane beta-barrel domain-containing protein [Novosphingobium sp. 1949]|uniref:Autotransporter outer membrane beta-barrel domain-containing protein n=1 Tax=Novosphingobium organovorum TaxID=2930092 RepID=A0ABT0BGJ4_9SPHN|nr:autotransporter outer membrane beta-barrel domain-containing protein [Novosphingobium organovorum]MCJ2184159.1 autotransporter outer membrane beta-barrel domain-containing protein [Novosphingobium organovorum]
MPRLWRVRPAPRRPALLLLAGAALAPLPALGQSDAAPSAAAQADDTSQSTSETTSAASGDTTTDSLASPSTDSAPAPATKLDVAPATAPTSPPPQLWSLALSGGLAARNDGPDGNWQSIALSRRLGRGYVRGSFMRYNGTLIQANTALPSNYYIGTLAAGGNFNNWVADGWVSYGVQDYGRISTDTGSRESAGSKSSPYYALGADFGRIVTFAPNWYMTPTVTASFAQGKLLRASPDTTLLNDLETDEPTLTGSLTMRLDHAFGRHDNHYFGLIASRHWSSNGISRVVVGETASDDDSTPVSLRSIHRADGWFEFGATGSLEVTPSLHLDLYATRTSGVASGNTTSGGVTLRKSF